MKKKNIDIMTVIRDDLYYHGIRDIENVFDNIDDEDDDYKSLLVKSSFDENYKYCEINIFT